MEGGTGRYCSQVINGSPEGSSADRTQHCEARMPEKELVSGPLPHLRVSLPQAPQLRLQSPQRLLRAPRPLRRRGCRLCVSRPPDIPRQPLQTVHLALGRHQLGLNGEDRAEAGVNKKRHERSHTQACEVFIVMWFNPAQAPMRKLVHCQLAVTGVSP